MTIEQWQTAVFIVAIVGFTLTAAVWDFRMRRIPNWLTLSGCVLGLIFRASFEGWPGIGDALAAFALGFGTLFLVWVTGGGGAGDVKLMGALGIWLGCTLTWHVIIGSVLFVVLLSAFASSSHTHSVATKDPVEPPIDGSEPPVNAPKPKTRVAFAIPVALATWLAVGLNLAGIQPPLP
jgi:prepilin peptidase CpaA